MAGADFRKKLCIANKKGRRKGGSLKNAKYR